MSDSSGSDVDIKNFGDYYVEFNMTIEKICPQVEESKEPKETFQDFPSPTINERKRSYNYQKLIREYEIAALEGVGKR